MLRLCPARAFFSLARVFSERLSAERSGAACLLDFRSRSPTEDETMSTTVPVTSV